MRGPCALLHHPLLPKAINSAYAQDDGGKEIEVKGLENGMQLKLDMFEPIDPKKTCIGKPTGKGVAAKPAATPDSKLAAKPAAGSF